MKARTHMTEQMPPNDVSISPWTLLKELVSAPGVPGREGPIRQVIQQHCERLGCFDEIQVDPLGSLICRRFPTERRNDSERRPKRVLVAAHMDQIGFLVSFIEDGGFLRLHPVGAFDPRTLFARAVRVVTEAGEILPGILHPEGRPLHTAPTKDLQVVPELEDFFVDLSMSENDVRKRVRPGDMVVFASSFEQVGSSLVAPALDDRAGCWAVLSALERLQTHDCEIVAAFTAQEEVGSRGAQPLSFAIDADIGIACDTTVCGALPGTSSQHHITQPGDGVSIQVADASTISDRGLVQEFESIAKENHIKCQRSLMLGGGQDGALIHTSRKGVPTIVLSCPIKYLHTSVEMVHTDDLESFRDLLAAALGAL